jgi:hypothetical protein
MQATTASPKIKPTINCLPPGMASTLWSAQEGPQTAAISCPSDIQFYGGARGGGKTDLVIGRQIRGAENYGSHWNGLIIRRKFRDFAEMRLRWDALIASGLPAERIGGDQQTNHIRFANGAKATLTAIARLSEADTFQGQQFTQTDIDEAPAFAFLPGLIEKLKGCMRSPYGVPCNMGLTGNPGGPGSAAVKMLFMDEKKPYKIYDDGSGMTTVFIPSKLTDNKILCDNDPLYVKRLMSIKDPVLRRAWLEGDWDAFVGQAIPFSHARHVIKPIPVPREAPLYMTFDWGYGRPFSVGWWWVDQIGKLYRFAEWYGCSGIPDDGLRYPDSRIKAGIIEKEKKLGIWGRQIQRMAGHDCWNSKPDYKGGGQGPATAEVFSNSPDPLYLNKADSKRELKLRMLREYMLLPEDGSRPMMQIYETCVDFIRTIPSLTMDEDRPEDVDTDQEDHAYDEACQIVMARPISLTTPDILTMPNPAEGIVDSIETEFEDMANEDMFGLGSNLSEDGGFYESV